MGASESEAVTVFTIPRVEAAALEVYAIADRLDEDGPLSYHEREGCYGADDVVPWPVAIDAGATPCRYCCESFHVDGSEPP